MQNCNSSKPIYKTAITILVVLLIILAIFFLYIHRMHLAAYSGLLSLLIILMCPLMHVFMHDHGSHKELNDHENDGMSCHHKPKDKHNKNGDKQGGNTHA